MVDLIVLIAENMRKKDSANVNPDEADEMVPKAKSRAVDFEAFFQRKFEGFLLVGLPFLESLAAFILILVAVAPPEGGIDNQSILNDSLNYRATYIAALVMSCFSLLPFVFGLVISLLFPKSFSLRGAWGYFTGSSLNANKKSLYDFHEIKKFNDAMMSKEMGAVMKKGKRSKRGSDES